MQSQFTDKAKNALANASKSARKLKQGYIGTDRKSTRLNSSHL